jgi:hypothetical protein
MIKGENRQHVTVAVFLAPAGPDGLEGHVENHGPAEETERKRPALADD